MMLRIPGSIKLKLTMNRDFFYLITLFAFSFVQILSQSMLYLFAFYSLMKFLILISLGLLTIYRLNLNKVYICFALTLLCVLSVVSYKTDRFYLFITALLIINAINIDFNKIVKTSIIASISSFLLVFGSSFIGIIPNRIFHREIGLAYCLGFTYYSSYPYIIMFAMFGYMYVRKKLTWLELVAFFGINSYIYKVSTLRLSYYLSIFSLILYIILYKFDIANINNKFIRFCSAIAYPITFAFTIICSLKYNPSNHVWRKLDDIFSSRISLSQEGFSKYDVKLFGQYIDVNTMINGRVVSNYFYIDSGFIYSILGYGILLSVLLTVMYSFIFVYCCDKNDKKMFIWCFTLLGFTVVNNVWLSIYTNCLLLIIINVIKYYLIDKNRLNPYELFDMITRKGRTKRLKR